MSRFFTSVVGGVVIAASSLVVATGGPVQALSFAGQTNFDVCAKEADVFCIEKFEFTPTGGTVRTVTPSRETMGVDAKDGTFLPDVNVTASFYSAYTGPSGTPDESGFLPALALNFYDRGSNPAGGAATAVGLRDGSYRVVLRTGDYDPSLMSLTGQFVSYSVVKGANGNFTVDLTAKPKPLARVVVLNNDATAVNSCEANNWVGTCTANQASRSYIDASFSMFSMATYRDAMRGAWIATNASTTQVSTADMLKGEINVVAKGPHILPSDFGAFAGAVLENGKQLTPAYFEEYLPFALISMMLSSATSSTITTQMVKDFIAGPTADPIARLKGSISVSTSGQAPVATAQTLGFTTDANGVRVNFNLTHFSAPNPSLKINVPASTTVTPVASIISTPTVKISKSASAKSIATYGRLAVLSTSKVSLKVVSGYSKFCKISGTTLKGVKVGSCKVKVTVTPKKGRALSKTVTLKIAK